jgi:hypothetical protein
MISGGNVFAGSEYSGVWKRPLSDFAVVDGDVDANGIINISDAVYLLTYVLADGPVPRSSKAADVDCSGLINVSDVVYLIAFVFSGAPAPCARF